MGEASVAPTPSPMVVRVVMDLFQHRYYRLSKTLMTFIGLWPYQSTCAKRGYLAVLIFLITNLIIPQLLAAARYRDDSSILLDSILAGLVNAVYVTKLIIFMQNSQKTLKLLNRIRTDWQVWASDQEVNILHEYADRGEKMTILYTAVIYSTQFVFLTQPIIPKIIDAVLGNNTESGKFPSPVVYYNLDAQKYYFYLILFYYVCEYLVTTILVTSDVMLIIYVQHVCSIFAAVGHKLVRIINNDLMLDKTDMVHLSSCVSRHNDAIEYVNLIEATYAWAFFFALGFGMILFNVTGLQILTKRNDPEEATRFIGLALCIVMHFYMECYISQILTDHSISIGFCIYYSQWYKLSPKACKLLKFMMMRCSVPCHLTTGKMLIMSINTLGLTLKTALSYLAFVRSSQGL